jgi:hypothetical protein
MRDDVTQCNIRYDRRGGHIQTSYLYVKFFLLGSYFDQIFWHLRAFSYFSMSLFEPFQVFVSPYVSIYRYDNFDMSIWSKHFDISATAYCKRMDLFDARVILMHVQYRSTRSFVCCSSLYPALSLPRGGRRLRNFGRDSSRIHVYALRNYASLYI